MLKNQIYCIRFGKFIGICIHLGRDSLWATRSSNYADSASNIARQKTQLLYTIYKHKNSNLASI